MFGKDYQIGRFSFARCHQSHKLPDMNWTRRNLLSTGAGFAAGACTLPLPGDDNLVRSTLPGAPLHVSKNRLVRVTVCTRPFRPAGPRIEAEHFDQKTVIHNYGHGGSGWSLSWACAEDAAALARATAAREFAVIGAGVIGMTTALRLLQTGAKVTIYAQEFPSETRSARATGVWSPSSRVGLKSAVSASFEDKWETWARTALKTHQHYIGSIGEPVGFQPFYSLNDGTSGSGPGETHDFLHLDNRLNGLLPRSVAMAQNDHSFPVENARRGLSMVFNIAAYSERLVRDFLGHGGTMIRHAFPDRAAALGLPESVIINCTGYGAKTLWEADELVPVRGQINWMPTQPEARYGLYYNDVYVLSRGDGLVVQFVGSNDDFGYGIESERADPSETRAAIETIAPLFGGLTV